MITQPYDDYVVKFNELNLGELTDTELSNALDDAKNVMNFYFNMQLSTKVGANSVYGYFGTNLSRYYNKAVASDITAEGQYYVKLMDKIANDYFHNEWHLDTKFLATLKEAFPEVVIVDAPTKIDPDFDMVVYGDTDSNYVEFGVVMQSLDLIGKGHKTRTIVDIIEFISYKLLDPIFNQVLETNITKRNGVNEMVFELELIGGKGIYLKKKKYVITKLWADGKYVAERGQFKVTGLELVQNSNSMLVKDKLKKFIGQILMRDISSREFLEMCSATKQALMNVTPEDLSKINKIDKYNKYCIDDTNEMRWASKCPAPVKGAIRYNYLIKKHGLSGKYDPLSPGMRVRWYYDKHGNPFAFHGESLPVEIMPELSVDIQLEKMLFNPIKRLMFTDDGVDLDQAGQSHVQLSFAKLIKKKPIQRK